MLIHNTALGARVCLLLPRKAYFFLFVFVTAGQFSLPAAQHTLGESK